MKHPNSLRRNIVALAMAALALVPALHATPPAHNIAAGNFEVVVNDVGDTTNSVTVTCPLSINDYRLRPNSNRGDYNVGIGPDATSNPANGVLMSSPSHNGTDYSGVIAGGGVSNVITACDFNANGWWIPAFGVMGLGGGQNPELNVNAAGAYFPFTNWIGGYTREETNNGPAIAVIGNTNLVLGVNVVDLRTTLGSNGQFVIDLKNLGYDSRASGVMLATGCKNESANYGLTSTNADGTWTLFVHDVGNNTTSHEEDPIAFVFIPKTNTTVISGRFDGAANIEMYSGNTPQFTVTSNALGIYELKPIGVPATNCVLITSPEGGRSINQDNFVSYQMNANQDGWIIQTRDCPAGGLERMPAGQSVCSFAIIPGGTPGFTVTPTNNIFTTEGGGSAQFSVVLDIQPKADVTISVSSSNPQEGTTDVSQLTFTADDWNIPHVVTVTGVDDAAADGTVNYTINLGTASSSDAGYNGIQPPSVTVGNQDDDSGITVAPTSGLFTTEAGGTTSFKVHLNIQPTADVIIPISSSNPNEGTADVSSLTFTTDNWNQDQTVTVTGVDDFVVDGDKAYTIITDLAQSSDPVFNGYNAPNVSIVNKDNDVAGITVSAAGPAGLNIVEGHGSNYTVQLNTQPSADVTINIASSDTTQGGTVSPSSLVFTANNWSNAQPVTVAAIDDLAVDGNTGWTISHTASSSDSSYAALPPVIVSATTLDNEPTITLPSGTLLYGVGAGAVGIDGRAALSDPNAPNYNGATLRVTITNNADAADQLSVRNDGSNTNQIGVSGNSISYGGTQIATFAGGSGASPLVVTFNGAATSTSVQATLDAVTFQTSKTDETQPTRAASVVFSHADGGAGSASLTIRVSLLHFADFQEGADHGYGAYTGENDVMIKEGNPNTAFPAPGGSGLFIDAPTVGGSRSEVLLRFDNIFGDGPGQIPSNSVIVSAKITFHTLDSGDGSPLYRMIQDWDATNANWTSLIGIQNGSSTGIALGSDARATADSVWGLPDGSGSTGLNAATVSVLPDVKAWQSGAEVNHGWALIGWDGNTDGTGFSPGESSDISFRPELRVLWVPPTVLTNSYRQNVNGYTNQIDTQIRGNTPTNSFATSTSIGPDWNVATPGDQSQVLIRFDNIFGTGPNQIPLGSHVQAAVLDLTSQGNLGQGDGGAFHAMLIPWNDTDTFSTFGNGIHADDVQSSSVISASAGSTALDRTVQGGYLSYDLTTDVALWASGAKPNYGWVILPWVNGGDGWFFSTAEQANESYRPQLRVYYTPGTYQPPLTIGSIQRTGSAAVINFTGAPNTTYSVVRSTTVHGTYTSAGTATTDGSGAATFTDNASPAGTAFYQISTQ
jgi:hypothetical protein